MLIIFRLNEILSLYISNTIIFTYGIIFAINIYFDLFKIFPNSIQLKSLFNIILLFLEKKIIQILFLIQF